MFRNATLKVNTRQVFLPPVSNTTNVVSPASSSDSRKSVTFEDDKSFTLQDISITVEKVILMYIPRNY